MQKMPPWRRLAEPEKFVNNESEQVDPIQRLADLLGEVLRGRNNEPVCNNPQAVPVTNFKDFRSVGPPRFKGTTDPIEVVTPPK